MSLNITTRGGNDTYLPTSGRRLNSNYMELIAAGSLPCNKFLGPDTNPQREAP
jgi:hypothetical protein